MKKIYSLIMITVFSLYLVACGGSKAVDFNEVLVEAELILNGNLNNSEITEDYFLLDQQVTVTIGSKNYVVDITWEALSSEVTLYPNEDKTLTANAIVKRPTAGNPDLVVNMKANFSINESKSEKIYQITIKAHPTYQYKVMLPDTQALKDEETPFIVADAPDLLILGIVLDSNHYYHYETMSGYEYIKVYNNTSEPYNLKNHRIVVASPLQGQNYENEASRVGNEVLSTGYLFYSLIDEDFILDPMSTGLIWLKPYNWIAGSGTNAYNKEFSTGLVHGDSETQKGAFNQTLQDFRNYWRLNDKTKVYESPNMPIIGKRAEGGTSDFFPILTPGGGTPYTHLNGQLIRSIEIAKFDDQDGKATIGLLNKYTSLPMDKKLKPDLVWGKEVFNAIEIKDNNELVDAYLYTNAHKYFTPVIRANVTGRINVNTLDANNKVSFNTTSAAGTMSWENTTELQFRPPLVGERVMQLQLLVRDYQLMTTYLNAQELSVMRYSTENISNYRLVEKEITVLVDPSIEGIEINFRTDELWSQARLSGANPETIKQINLRRP